MIVSHEFVCLVEEMERRLAMAVLMVLLVLLFGG